MLLDAGLTAALPDVAAEASRLADAGFDGAFTFEGAHDVFVPLAVAATAAPLTLYSNIAVAPPRSPVHLAHLAHDLQVLSGGRFLLGLGSQVKAHVERRYGALWGQPVERMREIVAALRAIERAWEGGEPLRFEGRWTTHTLMPPTFNPGPNPFGPPPILLAGVGPRMTALAAEVADGYLLHPFHTPASLAAVTQPALAAGLAAGSRDRGDLQVVATAMVGLGAGGDAAVRGMIGFYGSTPAYRPVLEAAGFGGLQPRLHALVRDGAWADLPALVPAELVAAVAVVGEADEVGAALAAKYAGLADRVAVSLPGADPSALAALAAAFRAAA